MFPLIHRKTIVTSLTEKQFLNRLNTYCIRRHAFDKCYTQQNVFVSKVRKDRFWIGYHLKDIGRGDGWYLDYIVGRYIVNDSGKIEITYRVGHRFSSMIPYTVLGIVGIPLLLLAILDYIRFHIVSWGQFFISLLFTGIFLYFTFGHSKKAKALLEKHFEKICSS